MRLIFVAAATAAVLIDRRSAGTIASNPRFERRSGHGITGMASYTDLVSCLEMAKDARQLNQGK